MWARRLYCRARFVFRIAVFISLFPGAAVLAGELKVDCAHRIGTLRPLHGGNCGPLAAGGLLDLSASFREVGFPSLRLHDCHWPNPDVVDLHVLFPNPRADPLRPESYDFARTDEYVRAVIEAGSSVLYRLGESIEHTKTKRYVNPPADVEQWAAVCAGVVRHYNQGWANGFHYDIRDWEIWNEPENRPAMWTGTDEDYLRLYATAARSLKSQFPALRIGGPALGYTGALKDGHFEASAFLVRFLERCRDQSLPLDFFSWHLYTDDPAECVIRAKGIRDALDRHGFAKTRSYLDEWNYLPGNDWRPMLPPGQGAQRERWFQQIGGAPGAAFSAAVLVQLQDAPVDMAHYYAADNLGFGMFGVHGTAHRPFFAFKAFRMLLDTPRRVATEGGDGSQIALCAGENENGNVVQVLVSRLSGPPRVELTVDSVPWKGASLVEAFVVDESHMLTPLDKSTVAAGAVRIVRDLPAPSVCLLRLTPAAP